MDPESPLQHIQWSEVDDSFSDMPSSASIANGDEDSDEECGHTSKYFACRYCHAADPLSAVRCNTCKKWFCNNRSCPTGPSHIVSHLVRSKHNAVSLHDTNPLGDSVLECYVCGAKNLFLLGFVPSKADAVMVLLCREPCVGSHAVADLEWDASLWQPLLEDRALLSWLVTSDPNVFNLTGKPKYRHVREIANGQIVKLEELWKTNPAGDLEDVVRSSAVVELERVPRQFNDAEEYVAKFEPLITAEANESKEMKESVQFAGLHVSWEFGVNKRYVAVFEMNSEDHLLSAGDNLIISHKGSSFSENGTIVLLEPGASTGTIVKVEMTTAIAPPTATDDYCANFLWNPVTFDRMRAALHTFFRDETSVSATLFNRILGHDSSPPPPPAAPADVTVPNLPRLNSSQVQAVRKVLSSQLSLIQGPPGTGKTVTSATLVYHMCKTNSAQVLVCSPSNVAVDQLAERLHLTGLNVVRVCAKSRESVATTVDKLTLHCQLTAFVNASPQQSELKKLMRLKNEVGNLCDRDKRRLRILCGEVEQSLLGAADVVCCTCSVAGDKRLEPYRFKYVLVDECTQAAEPECLIPLVHGAKQIVLVGDHCQMRPIIMCRRAEAAGLGRSLFERLVQLGETPIRLDVQYRMHPCLSEFSSNAFYEGSLQNGVTGEERDSSKYFPWPNPDMPMLFYNSTSPEELSGAGTSYINRTEAAVAEKAVTLLMKNGVRPTSIGVITPYEGQRAYLVNYMTRNGSLGPDVYRHIEVASVDSFQGREQEFIVLTCVRSNDKQGIGFLHEWRRLNVALTRARQGLIIIGNARVLARHPLWHGLVSHFNHARLVVDGPLTGLNSVNVTLPKPRAPEASDRDAPWYKPARRGLLGERADAARGEDDGDDDGDEIRPFIDFDYIPGHQNYALMERGPDTPRSQASLSVGSAFSGR